MIVVRYADDLVFGFEHEADARRFLDAMPAPSQIPKLHTRVRFPSPAPIISMTSLTSGIEAPPFVETTFGPRILAHRRPISNVLTDRLSAVCKTAKH